MKKRKKIREIMSEVSLEQQTDLRAEARNLIAFRKNFWRKREWIAFPEVTSVNLRWR